MDYLQYSSKNVIKTRSKYGVLNLIINGLPSILTDILVIHLLQCLIVLNLIINGLPSILLSSLLTISFTSDVLNLIINGLPSIL